MSSVGEADMATAASSVRIEDEMLESDTMSEPRIHISDEEDEATVIGCVLFHCHLKLRRRLKKYKSLNP
ncbi:hypothetical protein Dimus_008248, partial [Dionaea muscipula]